MRILLITDAWEPQINGVVRTLTTLRDHLGRRGHEVVTITPDQFRSVPCPSYHEIRLALRPGPGIAATIERFRPCVVHIATEGPLGFAARRYCVRRGVPFTTAFHTKFPEYVHARFGVPVAWSYRLLRWFHRPARSVMVATQGVEDELVAWGFGNLRRWTRGVDTTLFRPREERPGGPDPFAGLARPLWLYVGRVAVEKNLPAFLGLDLPGTKVVVGEGPQTADLKRRFPDAVFAGPYQGEALAARFAAADCFVFPSLTDTFGLVMLEALASGLPVAAFPVPGPQDVVGGTAVGVLDNDLRAAALRALEIPRARCRDFALAHSWEASVDQFLTNVAPFDPDAVLGAASAGATAPAGA